METVELKRDENLTVEQRREAMEGSIDIMQKMIMRVRYEIGWIEGREDMGKFLKVHKLVCERQKLADLEDVLARKQEGYKEFLAMICEGK